MKVTHIIVACLFTLLGGCAAQDDAKAPDPSDSISDVTAQVTPEQMLVGNWFGQVSLEGGGYRKWMVERRRDKIYRLRSRIYHDGTFEEEVEVGEWGLSGPIYFTAMRGWIQDKQFIPVDASSPYYRDSYKVIRLDNESFEYESEKSGERFKVKKVPLGFQLP